MSEKNCDRRDFLRMIGKKFVITGLVVPFVVADNTHEAETLGEELPSQDCIDSSGDETARGYGNGCQGCSANCASGCGVRCSGSCVGRCSGSCLTSCQNRCYDGCGTSCSKNCKGSNESHFYYG